MTDKELIIKSIENYTFYTLSQRFLLKTLYQLANDNCIYSSVSEISKITKISRASIYRMLSIFQKDGVISLPNKENSKLNQINLVPKKLDQIKDTFTKKINLQL
jgi:Fe2+ or Zn2+ uptake regulation protein